MIQNKRVVKCATVHILKRTAAAVDLAYKVHGRLGASGAGGAREPVLVLHGLLGSKRNWESTCGKIRAATRRAVVAADARNHGASPHASTHSYAELAADAARLLRALHVPAAAVLGHSMGGRAGMVLALTEPTKVTSLIVVDVSPVSTPGILNDFFPKLLDVMKSIDFNGMKDLSKARALAKDKLAASGAVRDPGTLGFVLMNVGVKQDKTIGWMCNVDTLKDQFNEIARFPKEMTGKQYNGRTLFIGGDQSNYIPAGDLAGIRRYFPRAELRVLARAGHNVHADAPAAFLHLVTEFLS